MRGLFRWWPPLLAAGIVALASTGAFRAEQAAKGNNNQELDKKELRSTIRALIKGGARLHNARDYTGSYRYFQGGATAIRSLLARRPKLQKALESSMDQAERNPSMKERDWILYRSLSRVYVNLGGKNLAKLTEDKASRDKKAKDKKRKDVKIRKKKPRKDKGKDKDRSTTDNQNSDKDKDVPKDLLKDVKRADKDKKDPKLEGRKPPRGNSKVQGKILFNDKPVMSGMIRFVSRKGHVYAARIVADGTYSLERIPPGEYRVAVTNPKAKNAKKDKGKAEDQRVRLPAKYSNPATSPLRCLVAEGKNEFDIKVEK